ncbi:hypothetical protein O181_128886 [Austropuccinia psidii MF-1]|uniref:Uncharacterized protein n=1 Tax=Austropuccinia psidii MF-1 TaxID=1389203 RepID=A0A9Q3KZ07_9BASI|nr:hypothetical protein [Austropuccinia psidii MF-1]
MNCSITVHLKFSATEHFNYDPKANLSNGSRKSHAVFTCLTAPPFVQRLSPGHTDGDLATVTCDQMHHVLFCMGPLGIAPTMDIQQGPHDHPPGRPHKDSFVVDNDETISERKWTPGPQAGRGERFSMISPVPSSIDLSTPPPRPPSDGHFTP